MDELARCGMRHAVTCPGSRNAPLALTLAARDGIEAMSVIDERSAGFVALGMAKAERSAGGHHLHLGHRGGQPAPRRGRGAGRRACRCSCSPPTARRSCARWAPGSRSTSSRLYGSAAKWFVEVGTHEPGARPRVHHRALACRAWWTAAGGRPGPVHLNFPLREPLAPVPEELEAADWAGRAERATLDRARGTRRRRTPTTSMTLAARLAGAPRAA